MKITCCKDCPDRHIGCHAVCERYLDQKATLEEEADRVREYKLVDIEYSKLSEDHLCRKIKKKIRQRR